MIRNIASLMVFIYIVDCGLRRLCPSSVINTFYNLVKGYPEDYIRHVDSFSHLLL